jgi:CheY-like chemotaxis protein
LTKDWRVEVGCRSSVQGTVPLDTIPPPTSVLPDVPAVVLTAHARHGDRERFLAAGTDGRISKPFNLAEVYQVLERIGAARRS